MHNSSTNIEMEKVVQFASRTGRQFQRYHSGRRQVVGCIPYRYVKPKRSCSANMNMNTNNNISEEAAAEIEVLLISSQKKHTTMMFPKGGWEMDESIEQAATRESLEEAGVVGTLQSLLGKWSFRSKSQLDTFHDGYMFPLLVEKQLDCWAEQSCRRRKWVKIEQAKEELCQHLWMKEAIDLLVQRLENNGVRSTQRSTTTQPLTQPAASSPQLMLENELVVPPAETSSSAYMCFGSEIGSCGVKINRSRDLRRAQRQIEVPQPC